jgi:hypothetical protein
MRHTEVEALKLAVESPVSIPHKSSAPVLPDGGEGAGRVMITKSVSELSAEEVRVPRFSRQREKAK